ncbi:MAG TPA: septum formation family protein [Acidimicrobiia bacterium]|nr:septum formation family protein [Acidimicrobiia bacterium]
MGRRGILVAGIAMVGLVAAGCSSHDDKAAAAALFHLRTGECITSPAGTAGRTVEVKDVADVPCAGAHDGEVFAVLAHPAAAGAAYPGDEALTDYAASECVGRFAGYTGSSYDDSDLAVATVRPDHDSWTSKDDREIGCVLYQKGGRLTGSRRQG